MAGHYGGDEAKNIHFGAGFQDPVSAAEVVSFKGNRDLSVEHHPFAASPAAQAFMASEANEVSSAEELPSWFARKVAEIVGRHGVQTFQAWQDGLRHAQDAAEYVVEGVEHVRVNFWDTLFWGGANSAAEWAAKGFEVIVSCPDYLYLDFPNEVHPEERGYYWGTRYTDCRKIFAFCPENLPQNAELSTDRDG